MLALGAVLAAATVIMGMALLGLSGWFITATAIAGLTPVSAIVFDVFMPSAGIRLLAIGRTFSRYGERLTTHDATLSVTAGLRERLFRGWAQPGAARRLLVRPARLLFRLTGDIDALESLYLRVLVPAAAALGAAVVAGFVFGFVNVWMGVVMAVWLVATGWGIALVIATRARRASMMRGLGLERLRARVVDLVAGQTELVMAGRMQAQCEAVANADRRLAHADLLLNRLETQSGAAYGVTGALTLSATLLAAGVLVERGAIGAPVAALLLLLALTATEPFAALRRGALEMGRTWLAIRRVAPRMETDGSQHAPALAPEGIELDGVSLAHAGGAGVAVRCPELRIGPHERVALIGPSGAGKSTLLAAIAGEMAPATGTVRAAPASWLTQRTELFQDSLRDNLRLACATADDARLWWALEEAGLADDVRGMAHALDTRLGEGGLGLSGGQARRLALARLLIKDAGFWLLDEPTEALDTVTAHDVLNRLGNQLSGRGLVIATHLRREAAMADRLLCFEGGDLVADLRRGTPHFDAALTALRQD
ncbi:ATP-binding cassette domain-containing protein [Variovorax sp. J22R133]|uniref:amino acid ABC transporter ATP-binding/permease protein n=1 Tax=Variovorax brevis TaxID=3053503 RepID=UPI002577F7FB|nr:ATP-binding cassette domain-containing protein [Variovorax sp. J22R133]MDM0115812.1 ATP-binding cassette domain-containing protein [Variovorax sp. J22R133]